MSTNTKEHFAKMQREGFNFVKRARFDWQTQHLIVAEQERKLLQPVRAIIERYGKTCSVLEVGCGEGSNLVNLNLNREGVVGVDYAFEKIEFCKKELPNVKFVLGDIRQLSFTDNSFDVVFARDILHHLYDIDDMFLATKELYRILRKGGTLISIESNARYNIILRVFGLVDRTEYNAKFFCPSFLKRLYKGCHNVAIEIREPSMVSKVIFHYKYGYPSLANYRIAPWCWKIWERLMAYTPKWSWSYMVLTSRK